MAEVGQSVKLFVGQVPKQMTESDLLDVFKEVALVEEVRVIKDKETGESRGCCFVICPSREEADKAVDAFHDRKMLPGASCPLKMKYADGELERLEHKLFVGMLPKSVSDADVSDLFSKYGTILDLQVIGGSLQASKGCAFIKFETKKQALAAIQALNGKHKMEGSTIPLVVKWADSEKERQARKVKRAFLEMLKAQSSALPLGYVPFNGCGYQADGTYGPISYRLQQLQNQLAFSSFVPPVKNGNSDLSSKNASKYALSLTSYAGLPYVTVQAGPLSPTTANSQSTTSPTSGSQIEGPPGANLFIFHIPKEFGDEDLVNAFKKFGKILSAKVFVDKATGISKCFGFVSFESPEAAEKGIKKMNGCQLGGRKLKVQLKRDDKQKTKQPKAGA